MENTMKEKIREKKYNVFINGEDNFQVRGIFPVKILSENFEIKFVDSLKEADLIIEFIERKNKIDILENKRYLFIAEDNLNFKKNLFSFIESFFHKLGFKEKKYEIMNFLDGVLPKKVSTISIYSFFPKYEKLTKKTLEDKNKNYFFITTNKIKHKNFISIPLFIQDYYHYLRKLLSKKIPSKKELAKKKFCAFVVSSNSSRERIEFFKKLSKYKKVDSYGKVMNNMGDLIQKSDWKINPNLFKEYKFVICFENSFAEDYITEKLPNVMFANSIPIYRGAKNVGEYFNTKSFINYKDYGSYKKMIDKIIELDQSEEKYLEFLRQSWFKGNKIPHTIKNKKAELIEFYKRILK